MSEAFRNGMAGFTFVFSVWVFSALLISGCTWFPASENPRTLFDDSQQLSLSRLSGVWEYQEGGVVYELVLDEKGNGSYDWHEGYFRTESFSENRWVGTWHQPGNDREGGYEAFLSEDGQLAEGRWWYTRIGNEENPDTGGGYFLLRRLGS